MIKILNYLKEFQRKHFDLKLYLICALFLAGCFIVNYTFDFEDSIVDSVRGTPWHWVTMMGFMLFPFLGVTLIINYFGKDKITIGSTKYWVTVFIGFSILALDRSFYGYRFLTDYLTQTEYTFISKCINWSSSLLVAVLPLTLVFLILDKDNEARFYGLGSRKFDPKPYFQLLLITVFIIGIGSFFGDLQRYYPRYQFSMGDQFAEDHELPKWLTLIIYELAYGSDFVAVEVFFRGFLIHAFVKFLGGYAVLPMVATYAFLHFGKPMTEAISSVFGGYILGIISYYTRNVWGGIIIHIGIAWAMELFGYLQQLI